MEPRVWELQTSSAEPCLDVFFMSCSTQGNQRAAHCLPGTDRLVVAFLWLLHDTAAHLAAWPAHKL